MRHQSGSLQEVERAISEPDPRVALAVTEADAMAVQATRLAVFPDRRALVEERLDSFGHAAGLAEVVEVQMLGRVERLVEWQIAPGAHRALGQAGDRRAPLKEIGEDFRQLGVQIRGGQPPMDEA